MKKQNSLLKLLSYLIPLFIIAFVLINCLVYLEALYGTNKAASYTDCELLRIKIYGSTSDSEINTISANFVIVDRNGNEIAAIERSWNGSYLAVEFSKIDFAGKEYYFPYKIYGRNQITQSRNSSRQGTILDKYYSEFGQCLLLGNNAPLQQKKNLYKISLLANKKLPVINFGLRSSYIVDLSSCKNEVYYSISVNSDSELTIQEL